MLNEVIIIGKVIGPVSSITTKNGLLRAQTRFEITEDRDDAAPWKTWCTIFCFGKNAEALTQAGQGQALLIRGRLSWFQTDGALGELAIHARSFTHFKMPEVSALAGADGDG
jgi:single-stranded DNA-binding protein